MIERKMLIVRLESYQEQPVEIKHALDILDESNSEFVSNNDIGSIWERISKAIDIKYSDDENHDAWKLELELSKAYKRN